VLLTHARRISMLPATVDQNVQARRLAVAVTAT
jgi:hypothetical protein